MLPKSGIFNSCLETFFMDYDSQNRKKGTKIEIVYNYNPRSTEEAIKKYRSETFNLPVDRVIVAILPRGYNYLFAHTSSSN